MKLKHILFLFLSISMLSQNGCTKDRKITPNHSTKTITIQNTTIVPNSPSINIPDFITREISLGTFGEAITLEGKERNDKQILFDNAKITLPKGKILTIATKTSGTAERFLNISAKEIKEFISILESSKIIDEKLLKKNASQALGAEINIVLQNTAQYIEISICASSDNNHWLKVYYGHDSSKDSLSLCVQSATLTNEIKKLTQWRVVSNKELLKAINVTGRDLYHQLNKEFELSDKDLEILKTAISEASPAVLEGSCPFDLTLEATLNNGEIIHMLWGDDSCGFIGIEGSAYRISREYTQKINELLTKKSPSPR